MNSQVPKQPVTSTDESSSAIVKEPYFPPRLVKMDQLAQVTGISAVTGAA